MRAEKNQLVQTLKSWGATQAQIDAILPNRGNACDKHPDHLKQRQHILESIDECLQLLFPEKRKRQYFMSHPSRTVFFTQRKPLDVLASGSISDLEQSYHSIRSMLCI